MTQPTEDGAKILDVKLFNQSTHHYNLTIKGSDVSITSNEESQEFNAYSRRPADPSRCLGDEKITGYGCFGNQHPEAVVRDMFRVRHWDVQTLREYSMFTIGDFLITTETSIYFSVNGDMVIKKLEDGFQTEKGLK